MTPISFPTGTAYTATDPALLTWVHVTLIHSQVLAYETFVEPLESDERDRYCRESAELAPLLRIPAGLLPTTYSELTGHLQARWLDGTIQVTETARRLSQDLLYPPGGPVARALLGSADLRLPDYCPVRFGRPTGFLGAEARQRRLDAISGGLRLARRGNSVAPTRMACGTAKESVPPVVESQRQR